MGKRGRDNGGGRKRGRGEEREVTKEEGRRGETRGSRKERKREAQGRGAKREEEGKGKRGRRR